MKKGLTNGNGKGSAADSGIGGESGNLNGIGSEIRDSESGPDTGTDTGGETGTGIFQDPGTLKGVYIDSESGEPKKRRGRPPGSGKGKTPGSSSPKSKTVPTLIGIEKILLSMHMMGAAMIGVPELQLSEDESKQLADSIERVAALYDMGMSEKAIAWSQLLMVAGATYGPRIFAYQLRTKAESAAEKKSKVQPISGPYNMAQNATP